MSRLKEEQGFTLVELLVVIIIIAVLAEIAIPAFLGEEAKASDAAAKTSVRTAQLAIETYRVDHGDYCGATAAKLIAIESTLRDAYRLSVDACQGGRDDSYSVSVTSRSTLGTVYTIALSDGTVVQRSCSTPGEGGCSTLGGW